MVCLIGGNGGGLKIVLGVDHYLVQHYASMYTKLVSHTLAVIQVDWDGLM
jgi:hypothetical protein